MATSAQKVCNHCGMTVTFGLANCLSCGAQVGTVFSEKEFKPLGRPVQKRKFDLSPEAKQYESIEKAKDRANNSLVLSLVSFFLPLLGFLLVVLAMVYGALGLRALRARQIEEGRGSAIAGMVISGLGMVAQIGYMLYVLKIASWTTSG